jgi:hypothetical protein
MIDRPLRIFIASASEGLDVANAIRDILRSNMDFEAKVWNQRTFKPSMTFIEALEAELAQSDFAVLTLTPDDQTESRGKISMTPRDNVLFELGLFMGRLGRERTYFVCDKNQDLKIPTDLLGVNPASYERRKGQKLEEAIATACSQIAQRMRELGVRLKRTPEVEIENRLVSSFCERIAGTWWGRQWSDEVRLSLFRIASDDGANTVQLDGDTFDQKGQLFGQWNSVAIGIRVKEATLSFYWEGTHPTISPGETFKGFGHYVFKGASGMYDRGNGLFADIHMGRKKPALWKSVELRRVDAPDLDRIALVMKNGTDADRASEVMRALAQFTGSRGKGPSLSE